MGWDGRNILHFMESGVVFWWLRYPISRDTVRVRAYFFPRHLSLNSPSTSKPNTPNIRYQTHPIHQAQPLINPVRTTTNTPLIHTLPTLLTTASLAPSNHLGPLTHLQAFSSAFFSPSPALSIHFFACPSTPSSSPEPWNWALCAAVLSDAYGFCT